MHERRGLFSEDRAVAAVRHDPQRRIRNPAKQFDGLLDRIERIAIAVHDQGPCRDRRQGRRGKVHVVAIVGELARVAPQRANLIVAEVMPAAHLRPLGLRSSFLRHRPHDGARLIGKTRRAADVNHCADPLRLPGGHVQQRVRARAHADGLDAIDAEMIQQREDIARNIREREGAARIRRSSMPAKIGDDDAVAFNGICEDMLPVIPGAGEAVKQQ